MVLVDTLNVYRKLPCHFSHHIDTRKAGIRARPLST